MKNKFLKSILMASVLVTSLFAEVDPYISVNVSGVSSGDSKVFGIQPVSELVGDSGSQVELRLGLSALDYDNYEKARSFLYIWGNGAKNNELGIGLGGEWIVRPFENKSFGLVIGGQAGIGYQSVAGSTTTVSTNVNKVTHIVGQNNVSSTIAEYEDDTYVFDLGLTLGTTYQFNKNLAFDLGYVYKYDIYQLSYRNQDSRSVLNEITVEQDNHMIKAGLVYRF